jgi:hypothetical protein
VHDPRFAGKGGPAQTNICPTAEAARQPTYSPRAQTDADGRWTIKRGRKRPADPSKPHEAIRSASCAHGTRCPRSWGVRHPPRPPRPARAWSPSSWGSVESPFNSASCRVIGPTACTPTWFGWSGALQITIQDFRVEEGLRTRGAMSPIPQRPIDAFRISHVQRSDDWIAITWNTMSSLAAFAVAGTEEQEGGEPPPLAGAGVVVCLSRPMSALIVLPAARLSTCLRAVLRRIRCHFGSASERAIVKAREVERWSY